MNVREAENLREGDYVADSEGTKFKFIRLDEDLDLVVEYAGASSGQITLLREGCTFTYPQTTRFEFYLRGKDEKKFVEWGYRGNFPAAVKRYNYLQHTFGDCAIKVLAVNITRQERDVTTKFEKECNENDVF